MLLHGIEGRGLEEVAEEVNLTHDATSKRWQRMRSRLLEEGPPEYLF